MLLDKFRKDIKTAADLMKSAFSTGSTQMAPAVEKAGKEVDNLTSKTKKSVNAVRELQKAWLDAIRAGTDVPGQRPVNVGNPRQDYSQYGATMNPTLGPMGPGGGLAGPTGYNGPTPPVIPPRVAGAAGAGGAAPQINSTLLAFGAIGAGLAGMRVAIGYVNFAFQKLLAPLNAVIRSADQASQLYAKALQGGGGMQFHTASDAFAGVLGVSEADVFKYSDAIEYLNKRMGSAIQTIGKTAPQLTTVSWEFKALQYQLRATFSTLASEVAPDLRQFANALNLVVQSIGKAIPLMINWAKSLVSQQAPLTSALYKLFSALGLKGGPAGAPVQSYQRLQASSWERMGLVLGHSSTNHAAQTAANTKRIASLMERFMIGVARITMPSGNQHDLNFSRP